MVLNKDDSKLFKTTPGSPAILNTWYLHDNSKKLVLIDQELTIKPLKVENYYE